MKYLFELHSTEMLEILGEVVTAGMLLYFCVYFLLADLTCCTCTEKN